MQVYNIVPSEGSLVKLLTLDDFFDNLYLNNNINNMKYQWKKFENTNQRLEHRITVTKSGYIGYPTKFYTDNNIRNYTYVVLYYDETNKAIGINFTTDEKEKNKLKILHNKQGHGGSIVARNFFKTYNIDPKIYYGRYEWEKENEEGIGMLYVFKLSEKNPNH